MDVRKRNDLAEVRPSQRASNAWSGLDASLRRTLGTLGVLSALIIGLCAGPPPVGAEDPPAEAGRVDVVFVLDNSGSMRQNDPAFLTRSAVSDFARALAAAPELDGRIAIVLFDGQARLVRSLGPASALPVIEQGLASLDFTGQHTNSSVAIERALYELRQNGRPDARQAIVLVSDGKIDTGDPDRDWEANRWLLEDLAQESSASGVQIFGVAFTDAADYRLMQALAQKTTARYYRAFAANELGPVVEDVLGEVSREESVASTTPDVAAATPDVAAMGEDPSGGRSWVLIALLPALILLVGAGVLWRRRSDGSTSTHTPPAAHLLDPTGRVVVAGGTLPLSSGRTRIGRDPHNDLVIADDTVSSEHAVIEVDAGRYFIEDRRSTNGTFLGDTRLDPDHKMPLKGGDRIRLAEVELMFVLPGYVPGGATVFIRSSARPADPEPVAAPVMGTPPPQPAIAEPEGQISDVDEDVAFAERRQQLDPAPVMDFDDESVAQDAINPEPPNGGEREHSRVEVETPTPFEQEPELRAEVDAVADEESPSAQDLPTPLQAETEPAEAAIEPVEPDEPDEQLTPVIPIGLARDQDAEITTPEQQADPVPEAASESVEPDVDLYQSCLDHHLERVAEIGPAFEEFTTRAFGRDLREALAMSARQLMNDALKLEKVAISEYTTNRIRYVICAVPSEMEDARSYFVSGYGGFTRMLTEQLQAPSFQKDQCEVLAVLSFGITGDSPWVSLSIVPDDGQDPRIDLLSYEFLSEDERREIEDAPNVEVSQSGLI